MSTSHGRTSDRHHHHPHHPRSNKPVKVAKSRTGKMSSGLVALSSAAVLSVYAAGYARTKDAADRLDEASARRQTEGGRGFIAGAPERHAGAPAAGTTSGQAPAGAPSAPAAEVHVSLPPAASASGVPSPSTLAAPAEPVAPKPTAPIPAAAQVAAPAAHAAPAIQTATSSTNATPVEAPSTPAAASEPAPAATAMASAEPLTPVPAAAPAKAPGLKDGTYTGWGTCRHGDIQAEVVVAEGRITSARIAQCWTRWSCSWLDPVVPQVVQRQGPNIDYVSGATQSTDAFYFAILDALLKAK